MVPPRIALGRLSRSLSVCVCLCLCPPVSVSLFLALAYLSHSLSLFYQSPSLCLSVCWFLQVFHRPQQYAGFLDMDLLDIALEVTHRQTKSSVVRSRTKA